MRWIACWSAFTYWFGFIQLPLLYFYGVGSLVGFHENILYIYVVLELWGNKKFCNFLTQVVFNAVEDFYICVLCKSGQWWNRAKFVLSSLCWTASYLVDLSCNHDLYPLGSLEGHGINSKGSNPYCYCFSSLYSYP